MKKTVFFSLLSGLLLLSGLAAAQTPFALSKIGQPAESRDARMVGRGGWGMAVQDSLNPGFTNLASLSALRHVAVRFTAHGEKAEHEDAAGQRTTHRTMIPDVRVGLPIIKGRLAFSTGLEVLRSFEYRTLLDNSWYAWDDTLSGNEQFLREGTLWHLPVGLSWRPVPLVSVGASIGLVKGSLREQFFTYFIEPSDSQGNPLYLNNGRLLKHEFAGTTSIFSFQMGSRSGFSVGASYQAPYDLDVERLLSVGGLAARTRDKLTMTMPEKWQAGFQLPLSGRWRAGGDGWFQPFSEFSGYDAWSGDLVDEYALNFGLERIRAFDRHGGGGNRPLRLGVQWKRWGYLLGGEDVVEKTISVGTGFPFRQKMGMLDVALSYSRLGDRAKNGIQSDIWRVTVSVAGLERWW